MSAQFEIKNDFSCLVHDVSQLQKFHPNLTKAKILESWNSYYASIEDFTFIVTGDFDVENLGQILVNNLSSFPIKK